MVSVVELLSLLLLLATAVGVPHLSKSGFASMRVSLCWRAGSVYLVFWSLSNFDHRSIRIRLIPLFSRLGYFSLTKDFCFLQNNRNALFGRFCLLAVVVVLVFACGCCCFDDC